MNTLTPGSRLFGHCNGYFGRDSYDDKTVLAAGSHEGVLWVVVSEGDYLRFASGFDAEDARAWAVQG